MLRIARSAAVFVSSAVMAGAGVVLAQPASAASAAYPECWVKKESPYTAAAGCVNVGTAKYRVTTFCIGPSGRTWELVGPWVKTGVSRATCSSNQTAGVYGTPEFEIG
ncbi:hypothetical protein OG357_12710 [Streptomyces sp. NBC_01255]|uniref:hypothetical protein n=1 Tax=Streptomyces sp. NBC_01255 TaxID=2903798 RepID=UPI002E362770|nr:hypothetical protein [Streptomyces sp. NBC_01255]